MVCRTRGHVHARTCHESGRCARSPPPGTRTAQILLPEAYQETVPEFDGNRRDFFDVCSATIAFVVIQLE
ncbi:uncharacterized protein MYCFIDRAFT_183736 [Pseudocercospora fijiensis CIRAD86]|uniref:Uncharacterized protein n=1 Tax=Pseudocercospora fijiensis (strain CIRAD86) TaxID=383855 RepID=M3AQY5_PSEFD|nr:uncharacterized protein MYCFIDRAFT_183736 [Pseudocercospora fijiensis CIRAD86]EME79508.1 hypothetical protein MYCFIDRAFT_183736 [Pseudocercospora fijiensis CIRAD86]